MKKIYILGLAALSLLSYSCNMVETEPQPVANEVTLSASMEDDSNTRSTVDNGELLWAEGDKISVFTSSNDFREFTLDNGQGTTVGLFKGTLINDETLTGLAVYPAGQHNYDGAVKVNYPATYGDSNAQYVPNTNALMVAEAIVAAEETGTPSLNFKHVGGIFAFEIVNLPKEATALKLTTNVAMTGAFSLVDGEARAEAGSSNVTINFAASESNREATTFYFPVPVAAYNGLELGYLVGENYTKIVSTEKTNTITRRKLLKFKLTLAEVGGSTETGTSVSVATEAALAAALQNETVSTVSLTAPVAVSQPLYVSGDMTLDLGNNDITPGSVVTKAGSAFPGQALIYVKRGATLTIKGTGKIDVENNSALFAAIQMTQPDESETEEPATLIIEGNPIIKGYNYAITGNGERDNTVIRINGGQITSYSGLGIFHPQNGILEVNGGTFTGSTAIEMRAGTLTINRGEFNATASSFAERTSGDGNTVLGAAIAVSQHSTDKDLKVEIAGGTFNGIYALYEKDQQNKTGLDKISLNVTTGTFYGKIYSQNCKKFIAGGTFNHLSALTYAADNANLDLVAGDYTIESNITANNVTVNGQSADNTKISYNQSYNATNLNVTFNKLTFITPNIGETKYIDFTQHAAEVTFNECVIENTYWCYNNGDARTIFNDCTFNQENKAYYNIWTYASNVDFNRCTFNSYGRSVHCYNEGAGENTINVTGCTFNANDTHSDYGAIAVDTQHNHNYIVNITDSKAEKFPFSETTGTQLCHLKEKTGTLGENLILTIDGIEYLAIGFTRNVATDIYSISNATGLRAFADYVNVRNNSFFGKTVKLESNIDLENQPWTPVGQTGSTMFLGTFDGQNKVISNLLINAPDENVSDNYSSALFGWIENHTTTTSAAIKNLKVSTAKVTGYHNVATIVGYITQNVRVENCHVTGAEITANYRNTEANADKAGVIVGNATIVAASIIDSCTSENSSVMAGRDAGQIVGASNVGSVTNCSATNVTVGKIDDDRVTGANITNGLIGRIL